MCGHRFSSRRARPAIKGRSVSRSVSFSSVCARNGIPSSDSASKTLACKTQSCWAKGEKGESNDRETDRQIDREREREREREKRGARLKNRGCLAHSRIKSLRLALRKSRNVTAHRLAESVLDNKNSPPRVAPPESRYILELIARYLAFDTFDETKTSREIRIAARTRNFRLSSIASTARARARALSAISRTRDTCTHARTHAHRGAHPYARI